MGKVKSTSNTEALSTKIHLLKPAEVAVALGVSKSRVYSMLSAGQLPVVRIGKSVRCPSEELGAWVKSRIRPGVAGESVG